MFNTTDTKTTTETTDTAKTPAQRRYQRYVARCQKIVDGAHDRVQAMMAELTRISSAAGEVGDMHMMESAYEARAALARLIVGPQGREREAAAAWGMISDQRVRNAFGALLATIAAMELDTGPVGDLLGDLDGYGREPVMDADAVKPKTAKRARKVVRK